MKNISSKVCITVRRFDDPRSISYEILVFTDAEMLKFNYCKLFLVFPAGWQHCK